MGVGLFERRGDHYRERPQGVAMLARQGCGRTPHCPNSKHFLTILFADFTLPLWMERFIVGMNKAAAFK